MKRLALCMLAVLATAMSACAWPVDTTFHDEGAAMVRDVSQLLVERGICPAEPIRCQQQAVRFYPFFGGFRVGTYGVEDPAVIQEIKDMATARFNKNPDIKILKYRAFESYDTSRGGSIKDVALIDSQILKR